MGSAYKAAIKEFGDKMTQEMKKECWDLIDKYLRIVSNDKKNNLSANVIACEKDFSLNLSENVRLIGLLETMERNQLRKDDLAELVRVAALRKEEEKEVKHG